MPSCGAGADGGGGRRTDHAVAVMLSRHAPVGEVRRTLAARDGTLEVSDLARVVILQGSRPGQGRGVRSVGLSETMTEADFDNGYWYVAELKDFARRIGMVGADRC